MKKTTTIIDYTRRAATALLLAAAFAATAWAQDDTSPWTIEKFNNGADCYITGYSGTTDGVTELTIPSTIDGATVVKFKDFGLGEFSGLVTLNFYGSTHIEEMPPVWNLPGFKNVNLLIDIGDGSYTTAANTLPPSIRVIPAYAFTSTALELLRIPAGATMSIGDNAFSNIHNPCTIVYEGPASDWNYKQFEGSPKLRVSGLSGSKAWYCGWFGPEDYTIKNKKLWWTMDDDGHMTITSANWDTFPQDQVLSVPYLHPGTVVKTLSIEHVYAIDASALENNVNTGTQEFTDLETVEIAHGLATIGKYAFKDLPKLTSITLPVTLESIGQQAFDYCTSFKDLYFDGTLAQWNAVAKGEGWNRGVSPGYQEHWRCTLTYDVQGHGTAPAAQSVYTATKLTAPEAPTAQGYTFGGWYEDEDCTQPFNFEGGVTADKTLYARWTARTDNVVTFNTGGRGTAPDSQTLTSGQTVTAPAWQTCTEGGTTYAIEAWYTTADCSGDAYDFTTAVDHSFTLYAKWAEATASATVSATEGGTVTLTDGQGREAAFGQLLAGRYTLTVTPASGHSFSGSYTRTNRSDYSAEMAHTFGGTTAYTEQIDLTAHDVAVNVTFSQMTDNSVFVSTATDGTAATGTFTLADGAGHSYTGDGTETLAKVDDGTDLFWDTSYDLTLTVTTADGVGCAITVVNGTQTILIDASTTTYTFTPKGSVDIRLHYFVNNLPDVTLTDNGSNSATIARNADGQPHTVQLSGRTLYKDGDWNTLCLPFALKSLTGTPLEGATVMRLNVRSTTGSGSKKKYQTRFDEEDGTLNLYFTAVTSGLEAGQPYIVKWETTGTDIVGPVFNGVFITATEPTVVTSNDGKVSFAGTYDYVEHTSENRSILFLGAASTLYFPQPSASQNPSIRANSAYFQLNGLTVGDGQSSAPMRSFVLSFGNDQGDNQGNDQGNDQGDDPTSTVPLCCNTVAAPSPVWFTLDGVRLSAKPTVPGLYINNGRKVLIP